MNTTKQAIFLCAACAMLLLAVVPARAQSACGGSPPEILAGDACDSTAGYLPLIPGLPLILPQDGVKGSWTGGPGTIDTGTIGDVDIAVRVGSFPSTAEVPAPAGSPGVALSQHVAGGGSTGQGAEVPFTIMLTDGPGITAYGSVLDGPELDERACAVYAFGDLDGDGVIGATNDDGSGDNAIERQEVLAHVGRQVGPLAAGRFVSSIGIQVAAPASMGGLVVELSAGAYTGDDVSVVWSDGTPVFTGWPFFPPLDPGEIIRLDDPNPPNPEGRNMIQFDPADFFVPEPDDPALGTPFAIPTDGSAPTTDQFISVSGPSVGARLFQEVDAATFQALSTVIIRPAPGEGGSGRVLVAPADDLNFAGGGVMSLRVLPVDLLGNVADVDGGGLTVELMASAGLQIVTPDNDGDSSVESITITDAAGVSISLDASSAGASAQLVVAEPVVLARAAVTEGGAAKRTGSRLVAQSRVSKGVGVDSDRDGVPDDGDGSGISGDRPCTRADIEDGIACDDNCRLVVNPGQVDSDGAGEGNCCDGTCVLDPESEGCMECPLWKARFRGTIGKANLSLISDGRSGLDRVKIRGATIAIGDGQSIDPGAEGVHFAILGTDTRYFWTDLPGVLARDDRTGSYAYRDAGGSLRSVRSARLVRTGSRSYRGSLRAKGSGIVAAAAGDDLAGVVLYLSIGDDAFSGYLACRGRPRAVRCHLR